MEYLALMGSNARFITESGNAQYNPDHLIFDQLKSLMPFAHLTIPFSVQNILLATQWKYPEFLSNSFHDGQQYRLYLHICKEKNNIFAYLVPGVPLSS